MLPMIAAKVIVALDSVKMEGGLPRQDGRAERAGRARSVKGSTLYRKKDVLIVKSHAFPAKTKHTRPSRVCVFTRRQAGPLHPDECTMISGMAFPCQ